jgi:tetratricopeptide (TPR) repeat protein
MVNILSGLFKKGTAAITVLASLSALAAAPVLADPASDAYNQGLDLKNKGKIQEALQSFGQAILLNPKYKDAYASRATLLNLQGQHQKAADDCSKIIELDPKNVQFLTFRGRLYYKLNKYQAAVDDLSKAISIYPRNGEALLFRSQAYEKLGKHDLASQDQDKAAQFGFKPGMF